MSSSTWVPWRSTTLGVTASLLGALAFLAAASAAPAVAAEEACANVANGQVRAETEQHRRESSVGANGQHYSAALPECRAYEMVSPVYKRSASAHEGAGNGSNVGFPLAPDGQTTEFISEGVFAGLENYMGSLSFQNPYYSRRSPSENGKEGQWATSSGTIPATLNLGPVLLAQYYDPSSPDLRSEEGGCGFASGRDPRLFAGFACAIRKQGGAWEPSPLFTVGNNTAPVEGGPNEVGASSDLSRIFLIPEVSLLPGVPGNQGLYEASGLGTAAPELRLENVDNSGGLLTMHAPAAVSNYSAPLVGDSRYQPHPNLPGTAYHAISKSGETVFMTAARAVSGAGTEEEKNVATIYARVPCKSGPNCFHVYVEPNGQRVEATEEKPPAGGTKVPGTGRETIEISKPAPPPACTETCAEPNKNPPADATFQGASADGSTMFFTTEQRLLNGPKPITALPATLELYEWHCASPCEHPSAEGKLTLISAGEPGTTFEGVVRTSSDGSHVYFVEKGQIPERPKLQQKNANGEAATTAQNVYGYDTETGETKFVAATAIDFLALGGLSPTAMRVDATKGEVSRDEFRPAQTTPDGRYLVFSGDRPLAGDTNTTNNARAAYRYDFGEPGEPNPNPGEAGKPNRGKLTWISRAAPACAGQEACGTGGMSAWIAQLPGSKHGAAPEIDDFNRAISGCPQEAAAKPFAGCEHPQEHDGEYVIFTTNEKLQSNDVNGAADVYEWHCASPCANPATEGVVSRISNGGGLTSSGTPEGSSPGGNEHTDTAMSASGSDIFFFTGTPLVKQDADSLGDLYDARAPAPGEPAGFAAPPVEPSCSDAACQGPAPATQLFGLAPSSLSSAGGNLSPGGGTLAFSTARATVTITKTKLATNSLLVTVKTSTQGTVTISGMGLRTTTYKNLKAGTHQIKVPFTKIGKAAKLHHKKTNLRVSLTVGKQTIAKTKAVRL
jgi:hypothetical protein